MLVIEAKRVNESAFDAPEFEPNEFEENAVETVPEFTPGEEPEEETEQPDVESIGVNDPITTYLREIGAVALLSREREVELAKEIEAGNREVLEAIFTTPMALRRVLELGRAFADGELELHQIIEKSDDEGDESNRVRRFQAFHEGHRAPALFKPGTGTIRPATSAQIAVKAAAYGAGEKARPDDSEDLRFACGASTLLGTRRGAGTPPGAGR